MRVEDLMIGNILSYNSQPFKVTALGTAGVICATNKAGLAISGGAENFAPITLTEPILTKFGFTWEEDIDSYQLEGEDGLQVLYRDVGIMELEITCYPCGMRRTMKTDQVEYIHQLQNHIFNMTGKPLHTKK